MSRAVRLMLHPVILLAGLAAVEGDPALGALESAILEARARSTPDGLRGCHFGFGMSLQC